MLLITGPSGNVGDELVDVLLRRPPGMPWRVASRHPEALRERVGDAAEVTAFDFFDRATWTATLRDVEVLFLLFPLPGNRAAREAVIPFVQAAEAAGCRHVVYVSVFGADRAKFIPHYKVEQALLGSSMTSTLLRCRFFMQNLHRVISTHGTDIAERGELFIPAGKGLTSFIDARDAAEVAALALTDPAAHRDKVYHLTGPAALSMDQVAAELTAALGFPVTYTHPGLVRFAARLRRRGVGWDTIAFMCDRLHADPAGSETNPSPATCTTSSAARHEHWRNSSKTVPGAGTKGSGRERLSQHCGHAARRPGRVLAGSSVADRHPGVHRPLRHRRRD